MGDMAELFDFDVDGDEWADEIRDTPPRFWLTATGDRVLIKTMKTSHLVNVLNLLGRRPKMSTAAGGTRRAYLKAEARKRSCPEVGIDRWRTPPADDFEHIDITRGLSV